MTLREDLVQILNERLEDDPIWAQVGEGDTKVTVSGATEPVLGTFVSFLSGYCDALRAMVLRLADEIDDLRESD